MKIAVIVSMFPTVSETFILNQITGLLDAGNKVSIIAGIHPRQKVLHRDFVRYDMQRITHWLPANKIWRFVQAFFLIIKNYKRASLLLRSLNFFKYGHYAFSLRIFYALLAALESGPFDIIYCHFGENGKLGAILQDFGIRGKLVVTFHGSDLSAVIASNGGTFYRDVFARAELLLPISDYWSERLIELGANRNQIRVHRMGIDTAKFDLHQKNGAANEVALLTVARLVEKKGIEYSLAAVAELIRNNPDKSITYRIIGDGPLRQRIWAQICEMELQERVILLGALEQSRVLEWFKKSDIFILASITATTGDQEGIPVSLMEAMAVGLPVVSTHHSGIPELIQDGQTGFLVPERQVAPLVEVLTALISNPHKRKTVGLAGRKFIEEHHSIQHLNGQLGQIFSQVQRNHVSPKTTEPIKTVST